MTRTTGRGWRGKGRRRANSWPKTCANGVKRRLLAVGRTIRDKGICRNFLSLRWLYCLFRERCWEKPVERNSFYAPAQGFHSFERQCNFKRVVALDKYGHTWIDRVCQNVTIASIDGPDAKSRVANGRWPSENHRKGILKALGGKSTTVDSSVWFPALTWNFPVCSGTAPGREGRLKPFNKNETSNASTLLTIRYGVCISLMITCFPWQWQSRGMGRGARLWNYREKGKSRGRAQVKLPAVEPTDTRVSIVPAICINKCRRTWEVSPQGRWRSVTKVGGPKTSRYREAEYLSALGSVP